MRIVVIGGTGHVGGYLIPRLVAAGHDVVSISRGNRAPYRTHPAWSKVTSVTIDREAEDANGTFGSAVAELSPDVVIDMVCFTAESAEQLMDALRGRVSLLVSCGSIWARGTLTEVPATEDDARHPWGEYGVGKAAIEDLLLAESRRPGGLASIVLHPGHISGPGWPVINPVGNLDLSVWETLATGDELLMPQLGLETVHHVHADDVAQAFQLAVERGSQAAGNAFYVVSERALTLRGFAQAVAGWFGQDARLRFVPFDEFRAATDASHADTSWAHLSRSHSMSIEKARRMLGYAPRYTSLEAVAEAVAWLQADGQLSLGGVAPAL
jgi:nucleoside-diphosphate-sugar epimerase